MFETMFARYKFARIRRVGHCISQYIVTKSRKSAACRFSPFKRAARVPKTRERRTVHAASGRCRGECSVATGGGRGDQSCAKYRGGRSRYVFLVVRFAESEYTTFVRVCASAAGRCEGKRRDERTQRKNDSASPCDLTSEEEALGWEQCLVRIPRCLTLVDFKGIPTAAQPCVRPDPFSNTSRSVLLFLYLCCL